MKRITILLATALTSIITSNTAFGVSYSVGGWMQQFPGPVTPPANAPWGPNGYPGDTVGFGGISGTLDLVDGTSVIKKINTLDWTIDYTYGGTATDAQSWSDISFAFNAIRSMQIGSTLGSVGQDGTLKATWDNDYLALSGGPLASFLVDGFRVDVTPLGLAEVGGSNFSGSNPWVQPSRDVMARFDIQRVPEGGVTAIMLGVGMLALKFARNRA